MGLIGRKIVEVRKMKQSEIKKEFGEEFDGETPVIILDDGTKIFPSCDEEGNHPGALFGSGKNGQFYIFGD